jgi:hypothetical protein
MFNLTMYFPIVGTNNQLNTCSFGSAGRMKLDEIKRKTPEKGKRKPAPCSRIIL